MPTEPRKRGLAAASPETRAQVARKGGQAVSQNRRHMAEIGRKGGEAVSQNREHMAAIGKKGGEAHGHGRRTESSQKEEVTGPIPSTEEKKSDS